MQEQAVLAVGSLPGHGAVDGDCVRRQTPRKSLHLRSSGLRIRSPDDINNHPSLFVDVMGQGHQHTKHLSIESVLCAKG
jgi:hypothetical protein